jgi:nitroreductase
MIIDILPVWLLFFITVGIVLLSVEIGFRIGRTVRGKTEEERESPASSIAGVILGLQAFMLAFTFGIVSDRYEAKKALVREEANTIRTAFHRSDFLSEPDRGKTKALLQEYVDQRIAVAQSRDAQLAYSSLGNALRMQQQLWDIALANARIDMNSDIGALYVESVNEIANVHAMRVGIGLQARIPTGIWAVLLSLLILGMIGVGYHTAIADSRRSRVAPILAVAFSLVVALIGALDNPGGSLMPISQQPLVNVQSEIKAVQGIGPK